MNKRILVTGANGYLGRHVVKYLLDAGCEVLAADIRFEGVDERAIQIHEPIFSKEAGLYEKMGKPDACIHMAWRDGFRHNAPTHMQDLSSHYDFVRNMLEGGLKQIAVMGSMHEIGYWEGAVDENTPTNPMSLYGVAKDALRRSLFLLEKEYQDVMIQWIRGYYITGEDQLNNSIFAKLMQAEQEGKEKFPFTSGKNKYDFIDIKDMAADIACVAMQNQVGGIINCCSGTPISLAEKVEAFIKEHNYKIQLEYGAFPDRPYDSPAIWGDASKIKEIRAMF